MEDELKKRSNSNYTTPSRKRKPQYISSDIDRRMTESEKKNYIKKRNPRKKMPANDPTKLPAGLKKDTTTSAYGDAGRGRPVPEFNQGGICRGAGAAIKGTNFKGVF